MSGITIPDNNTYIVNINRYSELQYGNRLYTNGNGDVLLTPSYVIEQINEGITSYLL